MLHVSSSKDGVLIIYEGTIIYVLLQQTRNIYRSAGQRVLKDEE